MQNFKLIALSLMALFFTPLKATELFESVQDYCMGKACQAGVFYYHIERDLKRYCDGINYVKSSKRKSQYLAHIAKRVIEHGAPEETIAIPLVETGLRPKVSSRAGAKGMWQFKAATAKENGLVVNQTVDERLDWKASTEAGLSYVTQLIKSFEGDTALGVLAYNVGIGRLRQKIKEFGTSSAFMLSNGIFVGREGEHYLNRVYGYSFVYYNPHVCEVNSEDSL